MSLIDKAALSVVAAASKDDARPALAGVLVGQGKAVCADGFRLMVADLPGPPHPDRPPVLVPAKALDAAVKGLGMKGDDCASVTAVTLRGVRRRDGREALAVLMPMTLRGFEGKGEEGGR